MTALEYVKDVAGRLGAVYFASGINWDCVAFPTKEQAEQFKAWCDNNGRESRAVAPSGAVKGGYGVRYR